MESDINLKHVPKQTGHFLPSMQKPVNNKIKDYDIIGVYMKAGLYMLSKKGPIYL